MYEAWLSSNEKPLNTDYNAYVQEMKNAGFTNEKYTDIARQLIKLFHYRECLLMGNDRASFIQRYYTNDQGVSSHKDTDLNLSIESYFLEQLNTLFQTSFHSIYAIHDKEIEAEQNLPAFLKFFKQHFQSVENRKRFTQKLQLDFMDGCIKFLKKEKEEPGFFGRYLYFIDLLIGVMAATFAVAYFAINVLLIPTFGLACIGIISAALAGMCTHLIIINTASLYYQRNAMNRTAIHHAIESISQEQKRLKSLANNTVQTTHKDLDDLKKYDNQEESAFTRILKLKQDHAIALGGVRAWIREFASRFQESQFIQIDLSDRLKSIISDAHDQTESLTKTLNNIVSSTHPHAADMTVLTKFIAETSKYILSPQHQAFIHTFEYVQKTKEQVLEIVSSINHRHINTPLPAALTTFYTRAISEGGLGGLISDLTQARTMAPVVDDHIQPNSEHPYHRFLKASLAIDLKLNASTNASMILHGDTHYRQILGLSNAHTQTLEDKITPSNIKDYLDNSFNFLCSLNDYQHHCGWREPFQHHDHFILYRMLLIKQLANFADPNNTRVDKLVKLDIKRFAQEKLNCNADIAFDDILNQALLIEKSAHGGSIKDQLNKSHALSELSFIADAIRVDIAYCSTALCPQQLIQFEMQDYIKNNNDTLLLGLNTDDPLIPAYSEDFYNDINTAITSTEAFIKHIQTRPLIIQTKTIDRYYEAISSEIETITLQINRLIELETQQQVINNDELLKIKVKLEEFKTKYIPQTRIVLHAEEAFQTSDEEADEESSETSDDESTHTSVVEDPTVDNLTTQLSSVTQNIQDRLAAVFTAPIADTEQEHRHAVDPTFDCIATQLSSVAHDIQDSFAAIFPSTVAENKAEEKKSPSPTATEEVLEKELSLADKNKITLLQRYITHESEKKFLLFCHHTPEEKKLAAEEAIKDIQAHRPITNPVCLSNKHLQEIIGL